MASNGGRAGPEWQALERWVITTYTHCHLCDKPVNKRLPRTHRLGWTVDHIKPISLGGALYARSNGALAHRRCNEQRGNKTLDEWRKWFAANHKPVLSAFQKNL